MLSTRGSVNFVFALPATLIGARPVAPVETSRATIALVHFSIAQATPARLVPFHFALSPRTMPRNAFSSREQSLGTIAPPRFDRLLLESARCGLRRCFFVELHWENAAQ